MRIFPEHLDRPAQRALLGEVQAILAKAPLYRATMPRSGKPMSVRMSNAGKLGWYSDAAGYRYVATHPLTGAPWPAMPPMLLRLWSEVADYRAPPQACLINVYDQDARLGLHRDEDEEDFAAPVLSVSLGDDALFRLGGTTRKDPTRSFTLASGDVLVLDGESRLFYHGVDRIIAGSSRLIPGGGRINLTLRRVTKA